MTISAPGFSTLESGVVSACRQEPTLDISVKVESTDRPGRITVNVSWSAGAIETGIPRIRFP